MLGSTISVDVENYFRHLDQMLQVFVETKQCLEDVDYDEHFDAKLYEAAALGESEETTLQCCFSKSPCFLIFGQSSVSKAAVVNELLGVNLLPTVIEEKLTKSYQDDDADRWRTIFIHFGSEINCSLVSRNENVNQEIKLTLNNDNLTESGGLPRRVLRLDSSSSSSENDDAILDIQLNNVLLTKACIVTPCYDSTSKLTEIFLEWSRKSVVVPIYVVNNVSLNEKDVDYLTSLKRVAPEIPVFFVKSRSYVRFDLPESDQYGFACVTNSTFDAATPPSPYNNRPFQTSQQSPNSSNAQSQFICYGSPSNFDFGGGGGETTHQNLRRQLLELGFLTNDNKNAPKKQSRKMSYEQIFQAATTLKSDFIENGHDFPKLVWFVRQVLRSRLLQLASRINTWHDSLMHLFILTAFDMARDQIITPKRIIYARNKCLELYASLMKSTLQKQQEIETLIATTIAECKTDIIDDAGRLYVARDATTAVPTSSSIDSHSDYIGESLVTIEEIQRFVLYKLNKSIADRLTNSFLCLKQTFIGTLQRCLDSLETNVADENENVAASSALKQMLTAAYDVELTWKACTPFVSLLWDKMKQVGCDTARLLLPCCPYVTPRCSSCCEKFVDRSSSVDDDDDRTQFAFDSDDDFEALTSSYYYAGDSSVDDEEFAKWRKTVAAETLRKLSEAKLARVLCCQFQTRISMAHEAFQLSLNLIEYYHTDRLRKAEEQRLTLRKQHAPRLARLAMESLALRDSLIYGMPKLGLEIGRGQYGVVYQCDNWGTFGSCAVKSVVPPDDKHWNDLALEFHYTKCLIEHERIVKLHGAVIDHNYGGGGGSLPAVLLIMERMKRDLHSAIRGGLNFAARLRVAIDVVEGLRFLHSQGLVHRDIKLKNVLLDENNRAKITDLGFCKPEAMMSGSVVGTPIHMAPELFSRNYDSSVDVYAFGVLFWYVCAGHVRLPQTFEQCINKDQLWSSVKQGVRPEQLTCFDAECWDIMEACWSGEPSRRPHLGDIQPRLEKLLEQHLERINNNGNNSSS